MKTTENDIPGWFRYLSIIVLIMASCTSCTFNLPNLEELHTEAASFATDSIQKIGEYWDANVFIQRADSSLTTGNDPSPVFRIFANKLGSITKIGELESSKSDEVVTIAGFNRPDYSNVYKCSVNCQKGHATIVIGVIHKNNQWLLSSFNVNSKVLDKMNGRDDSEAKHYVEHMIPLACNNMNVDFLKEHADPKLADEMKNPIEMMAGNGIFSTISKTLGHFKKCNSISKAASTFYEGRYVYRYIAQAEFEHGRATISIAVSKHNGNWGLMSFNVKTHS